MLEKRNIVTSDTPQDTAKTAEVAERGAKAFARDGTAPKPEVPPARAPINQKDADNAGATSTR